MTADIIDFFTREHVSQDHVPIPPAKPHPECLKSLTDILHNADVDDDIDIRKAIIVLPHELGGVSTVYFDWFHNKDAVIEQLQDAIERLRASE